jgi:hypothetical protein
MRVFLRAMDRYHGMALPVLPRAANRTAGARMCLVFGWQMADPSVLQNVAPNSYLERACCIARAYKYGNT